MDKLIPEQVFFFFFFFHLEEALYRSTGDSLHSMPANVIEFMFLASLDCVLFTTKKKELLTASL
jgi:hypothetical protein